MLNTEDDVAERAIRIMCPNLRCRAVLAVPTEARGRLVRCKSCGSNIRIPQKQAEVEILDGDSVEVNGASQSGTDKKKQKKGNAKDAA